MKKTVKLMNTEIQLLIFPAMKKRRLENIFREHFPNADAVAVILNPEAFIEDISKSIGTDIKAGKVNYFYIDKGYGTKDGRTAMDMEYKKYLLQDAAPEKSRWWNKTCFLCRLCL